MLRKGKQRVINSTQFSTGTQLAFFDRSTEHRDIFVKKCGSNVQMFLKRMACFVHIELCYSLIINMLLFNLSHNLYNVFYIIDNYFT